MKQSILKLLVKLPKKSQNCFLPRENEFIAAVLTLSYIKHDNQISTLLWSRYDTTHFILRT